jgi:metal transporter CNNM
MKMLFLNILVILQVVNGQNELRTLREVGPTADTIGGNLPNCVDPEEENKEIPLWNYFAIAFLACLSGTFSGLNLGLLGLDVKNLELLTKGPFNTIEEETDAKYALAILPLRRRGNLLLCTILLGNVTVNSAMSILMSDLTSGLMGLISSTAIIVIFGEIVP